MTKVLGKVKISGGGRCNVTHACFIPKELVEYYPRGGKELLGPFHRFAPGDTIAWFERRGVELKTEADGRMFPVTDRSETIIECFLFQAQKLGIDIRYKHPLMDFIKNDHGFQLVFEGQQDVQVDKIIFASGPNDKVWDILQAHGHHLISPVPSLFTFNIDDERIRLFPGTSWSSVGINILGTKIESTGPLLITHWGLSGPAILKLSAFASLQLHQLHYDFDIKINFMWPDRLPATLEYLKETRASNLNKLVHNTPIRGFTTRVWQQWCESVFKLNQMRWQELSAKELNRMAAYLAEAIFHVHGKSTFKEEFVTAGGVDLKEVNMKTMESKVIQGVYFAGEILNIDALTGGFNFQAAWTTGWIAGETL
jgi:predicted Rossmann fold flavoprotein